MLSVKRFREKVSTTEIQKAYQKKGNVKDQVLSIKKRPKRLEEKIASGAFLFQ